MSAKVPSPYGRRLMPVVLDELATKTPDKLYASIPVSADITQGFRDITVADMARSVDFMAEWIKSRFGISDRFETVSYIGISDLRGVVVWHAAVKCGFKLLVPSPRNPPATNMSLMNQTGSKLLLHAAEIGPVVTPVQSLDQTIRLEAIPSFQDMLESKPRHFPFHKTFEQAKDDPVLIMHSSGSTGLPKPIITTNMSYAVLDNEKNLPDIPGRKRQDWSLWNFPGEEARVYSVYPFFHFGGIVSFALNPVFNNASPVLGPPHMMPDGSLVKHILSHCKLRALILVPAIVEQILHEPNGIELFKPVEFLCYAGAPFNPVSGNRIAKFVDLISPYGATEIFPLPELMTDREDWEYHEFNPSLKHEMQEYDAKEGTYELVVFADETNRETAAIHHNLPGVSEYRTKDLWTRHPDPAKPTLWRFYGRKDDIIVLSNGEKFNPVPFEMNISNHPGITAAIVVGNNRNQAALLVEPSQLLDQTGQSQLLDKLWPDVEKSNALVPGQGRIRNPAMILFASPEKPLPRTGKNTVMRQRSEQLYADELSRAYSASSAGTASSHTVHLEGTLKTTYSLPAITAFVRRILIPSLPEAATLGEDEDLFAYGLDSLQTLEVTANLRHNLGPKTAQPVSWIRPRTVFDNPSIADLARVLHAFLNEGGVPDQDSDFARARAVEDAAERYSRDLPSIARPTTATSTATVEVTTIAVLGSTGYLGTHLLICLLRNPQITHIYCLNRSADAQQKQEAALQNLVGDEATPLLSKLRYTTITFGQPSLGLSETEYATLAASVDAIVYNAWRLAFGLALKSFDPFLRATVELIRLSASGTKTPRIVFISSQSAVAQLAHDSRAPEAPVQDPLAALDVGYAQSKLVAEQVLARAGVPAAVIRVCQVGGPTSAYPGQKWAEQHWLSDMIRTSRTLDCAPAGVGLIDWVPVDVAASAIHDVVVCPSPSPTSNTDQQEEPGIQFFNLSAPEPKPWAVFLQIFQEKFGIRDSVPLRDWVARLRHVRENPTADDLAGLPSLKILNYWEAAGDGLEAFEWETENMSRVSRVEIPSVSSEMIEGWLSGWDL
ncbi:acetyl-CoA synthetase-like protein [Whalleya microplaca]|nr:acetyl-CoA synthetase-like protein [Whalleya microplaca]